jgi:hypothetical protein
MTNSAVQEPATMLQETAYHHEPYRFAGEGNRIRSLLLVFDGLAVLVPDYMRVALPKGGTGRTTSAAESAYLAVASDLDQLRDAPDSFAQWVDRAIRRHTAHTAERRAQLARKLPAEEGGAASRPSTSARRPWTRWRTRSSTTAPTAEASPAPSSCPKPPWLAPRRRARWHGHDLPPSPARLPNRPPRT